MNHHLTKMSNFKMLHATYEEKQKVKAISVYFKSDAAALKKTADIKNMNLPSFAPDRFSLSFK